MTERKEYNNPLNQGINGVDGQFIRDNESCMTCDNMFNNKMACNDCENFDNWCLARDVVFTD